MRPATAILWTSIVAKIIELSFVTGFVAFLGQVLSRRAFSRASGGRGVTLSELSMWRWVVQPGTLITHWETAKYAGLSFGHAESAECNFGYTLRACSNRFGSTNVEEWVFGDQGHDRQRKE